MANKKARVNDRKEYVEAPVFGVHMYKARVRTKHRELVAFYILGRSKEEARELMEFVMRLRRRASFHAKDVLLSVNEAKCVGPFARKNDLGSVGSLARRPTRNDQEVEG